MSEIMKMAKDWDYTGTIDLEQRLDYKGASAVRVVCDVPELQNIEVRYKMDKRTTIEQLKGCEREMRPAFESFQKHVKGPYNVLDVSFRKFDREASLTIKLDPIPDTRKYIDKFIHCLEETENVLK